MATISRARAQRDRRGGDLDRVQWNETAGMAEHRMRLAGVESLLVLADDRPIGNVTRRDIERCRNCGNWLEAVTVLDLVHETRDT